jgi:septum formation protein
MLLERAGLTIIVDPPELDEEAIKFEGKVHRWSAADTAGKLAEAKARQIAQRHPDRIVLGADQMLECDGAWFDKPVDRAAAARQIARLAGRTHTLFSAVVAIHNGDAIWRGLDTADLSVRSLSPAFIETYLDRVGDAVLSSVGGYQVEGLGIQLFDAIRGDHATILGMPLIPLLGFLRAEGVIAS